MSLKGSNGCDESSLLYKGPVREDGTTWSSGELSCSLLSTIFGFFSDGLDKVAYLIKSTDMTLENVLRIHKPFLQTL